MSRRTKKLIGFLCAVMLLAGTVGIAKSSYSTSRYLPGDDVIGLVSLDAPKC